MSTPPLLVLPESSCAASIIMTLARTVGITESPFTREEQAFKWPGERWSASFSLPPIKREIAGDWLAFGIGLEGSYGRFLFGDPSAKVPRGVATGAPVVDGAGQTGNTLFVRGFSNTVTGILKAGDYIQINTGLASRLHMIMEDANSDGTGRATLSIQPALRSSPADGVAIVTNSAKGLFRMAGNDFSWSVIPGGFYRINFEALEVVSA